MVDTETNERKRSIAAATRTSERGERRRRAICPTSVIHSHLNPWTLNDFPRGKKLLVSAVCALVCMCVWQREKESVPALTSAVQNPHFTASAPLSIAPCSLYAPSLSLYFATWPPTLSCHRDAYLLFLGDARTHFSLSASTPVALTSAFGTASQSVSQSACFGLSGWFLDWLSISMLGGHSVSLCLCLWPAFLSAHLSASVSPLSFCTAKTGSQESLS